MKTFEKRSLTVQLAWRLCVLQVILMVIAMVALAYRFFDGQSTYIDDANVAIFSDAIELTDNGPVFRETAALAALLKEHPAAWAVVADAEGRTARYRQAPEMFQPMIARLPHLGASELRTTEDLTTLSMKVVLQDRDGAMLRLMVGGVPSTGYFRIMLLIVRALTPFFVWPLILLTLLAVPWLIVSATAGVRRVAKQAAGLDMARASEPLDELAVPHEIRPLVSAFNVAMERVREGYQARDRFLRDAAHELRMPIAVLSTRLEAMPASPLRVQLLTEMARLANIAEQLLDLERLRSPQPDLGALDLVELVRDVISDAAPLVVARGYELSFVAPDEPVMVLGHASSLSRVATNLVQNAIVHGGGAGLIQVTVGAQGWFEVRDQGEGIPVDEKAHIFRPFYRAHPTSEGHGLGLHLSQEIVARHGGRIRVSNAPGGGANFRVALKTAR